LTVLTFENLRLTKSKLVEEYFMNTNVLVARGNVEFAGYMTTAASTGRRPARSGCQPRFEKPYLLYHSWLPGMIELDEESACTVAELVSDWRAARWSPRHGAMAGALEQLGWLVDGPPDLGLVADRTATVFLAMQNLWELRRFLWMVYSRRPEVVVEIGTARGGTLYALSQTAAPHATLVSIDLPGGGNGGGQTSGEIEMFSSFGASTQTMHSFLGRSTDPAMLELLEELLQGRSIDLLFIDGDHSYNGVKTDLLLYGPKVAPDGLVALHDICLVPEVWGPRTGVGVLWRELQTVADHSLVELVDPSGVTTREKRKGEVWSWGIGLLSGAACASALRKLAD